MTNKKTKNKYSLDKGILRVVKATGVTEMTSETPLRCMVYTMGGALAGTLECVPESLRCMMKNQGYKSGTYTVKWYKDNGSTFYYK